MATNVGRYGSGSYGSAQNQQGSFGAGVYGAGVYGAVLPVRVSNNFTDTTAQANKSQAGYNQWSERAIIQNYNSTTDSYEITIAAQSQQGATAGSAPGAIITNVKATIPAGVNQFSPGDSVLIGYVSGQREHPIIVGGGDHTSQLAPVVTLPNPDQPQGASTPDLASTPATQTPTCTMQILDPTTGSGTSIKVDCSKRNADGSLQFSIPPYVACGIDQITWSVTAAGMTTSAGITVSGFGPNNSLLSIILPANPGSGVAGHAYAIAWKYKDSDLGACATGWIQRVFGCNDNSFEITSFNLPEVCNNITISSLSQLQCNKCHDDYPGCGGSSSQCDSSQPPGRSCGNTEINWSGIDGPGLMCDLRTPTMIAQGCTPCGLTLKGGLITAIDSQGRFVTVVVQ